MLEFNILKGQYLNRLDKNVVSADTTDLKAQFDLTSDFAGTITVWWRRSDVNNTYTSTLASDGTCTIPAEALAATDKAVYGPYDHDVFVSISDTGRTTTNEYKLTVQRSAFSTDATPGTGGSPTAYEELVEQFDELKAENQTFKDDMTEQQKTFESTVTENVDNIRYVVETETAPPIIEEASGAEITLEDSAYRQVRGLNLYGYSKQIQTTGAQLMPITEENVKGTNGLTATLNPDGSIKITGMPTVRHARALVDTNVSLSPGTYRVSGGSYGPGHVIAKVQIIRSTEEKWFADGSFEVQNGDKASVAIVYDSSTLQAVDISSFKPMLNVGTSPLPWEPYSGGYASPSPDWAQPITSVGDGGSVTVNSVGAQLMPITEENVKGTNGLTATLNPDGSIKITGMPTVRHARALVDTNVSLSPGTYRVSGGSYGPGHVIAKVQIIRSTEEKWFADGSFEVQNGDKASVAIVYDSSTLQAVDISSFKPMLNVGTSPLPWQPYVAPSSALIALTDSLRGIPVTSGGNYTDEDGQQWIADYIYRRQTDGKWMIWRKCGSTAYDGSEDEAWSQSPSVSYRFIINGSTSPALSAAIASSFKVSTKGTTDVGQFVVNDGNNSRYFNSNQNSLEAWKAWLAENPQTVVYQLATPTIEELPTDVQTELNGLMTYNLHTDMWNNDGAFMNLKYVADTKTWINKKIAGISTAMIENL